MIKGEKISALLPKIWKKAFNRQVVIPAKTRFCNACNDEFFCDRCNNRVNEIKEIEAILIPLKDNLTNLVICFLIINITTIYLCKM